MSLLIGLSFFFRGGWTWSLYDEISWIEIFRRQHSAFPVLDFVKTDWIANGRFRPLSSAYVFWKFELLGLDPWLLRLTRYFEFSALAGLVIALARKYRLSWLSVALTVGFVLKSPPLLEQIRWMTLSELTALNFVLLALLCTSIWKGVFSYFFLALAALTKEPFSLFFALPAVLQKRRKAAALAFGATALHFGWLYLNRRNYTANYSILSGSSTAAFEILRGFLMDTAPLLLVLGLLFLSRRGLKLEKLYSPFAFFAFSAAYLGLVIPKAWGYTYILAPSLLLLAFTFGFLSQILQEQNPRRWVVFFLGALAILQPFRLDWNLNRVWKASRGRADIIQSIAMHPGVVSVNCQIDGAGIAYAADGRKDGASCFHSVKECCKNADFIALGEECLRYPSLRDEARQSLLPLVHFNANWEMYSCATQNSKLQ